jgi:hypothetical protein
VTNSSRIRIAVTGGRITAGAIVTAALLAMHFVHLWSGFWHIDDVGSHITIEFIVGVTALVVGLFIFRAYGRIPKHGSLSRGEYDVKVNPLRVRLMSRLLTLSGSTME